MAIGSILIRVRDPAVDQPNALLQRRQFGRRQANLLALVSLPGRAPIECTIENISEGGALLRIGEENLPNRPFRLSIAGVKFDLFCELRHQGKHGAGVRFLSAQDGATVMRQLYPDAAKVSDAVARCGTLDRSADIAAMPLSHRDMRDTLLAAQSTRRIADFANLRFARTGAKCWLQVAVVSALIQASSPGPMDREYSPSSFYASAGRA